MPKQKYHILLFFFSLPFIFMIYKGWWSRFHGHWSSEAYPFLVLFATLAEIYFSRRKLVVAGMIGMGVFLLGALLHTGHWPGDRLCIFAGVACLMIIPIWSAVTSRKQRVLNIIIAIWILLYGTGVVMDVFGLRVDALFRMASIIYLPVVTGALGISFWKTKQQHSNDSNV